MRLLRWLAIGLVLLGLCVAGVVVVGARASLDRRLLHTQRTAELPVLAVGQSEGLVRIPTEPGDLVFRARVAGLDNDGPALLLLHGFPETSIMWTPLIQAASAAGFRVAAFDQRGYSPGARPDGPSEYTVPTLEADALAVADALGFDRFHLVGHDWGSIVGWVLAAQRPDRVISWASLSIPHPGAILAARADGGEPFYVSLFRRPGIVETLFTFNGLSLMRGVVYPEMPPDDLAEYMAIFSEPGALTAALNWYRASPRGRPPWGLDGAPVAQPSLYVYGNRDMPVFVGPAVQAEHPRFVHGPLTVVELDAGHWLIQERTTAVVEAVMAHLSEHRSLP